MLINNTVSVFQIAKVSLEKWPAGPDLATECVPNYILWFRLRVQCGGGGGGEILQHLQTLQSQPGGWLQPITVNVL